MTVRFPPLPAFLDRRGSNTKTPRQFSPEVQEDREIKRLGKFCRDARRRANRKKAAAERRRRKS